MKSLLEKYFKTTDHLSDEELKLLIDHFQRVIDDIEPFGERFEIVRVDLRLALNRLLAYKRNRRIK